jgi:hypothetical protein
VIPGTLNAPALAAAQLGLHAAAPITAPTQATSAAQWEPVLVDGTVVAMLANARPKMANAAVTGPTARLEITVVSGRAWTSAVLRLDALEKMIVEI